MSDEVVTVSAVFSQVTRLAMALGHEQINKLPGCLEIQVDESWWFAINAHPDKVNCSKDHSVPPMCVYIEFNGWPFGMVSPQDGCLLGLGNLANEDALIEALKAARERIEYKAAAPTVKKMDLPNGFDNEWRSDAERAKR